jgi:predicted amidophosphoribosyltransferase
MRLGLYEGIVRDAVLDLKFRRWRLTGMQLGAAFGVEIGTRIRELGLLPSEVLFVPIPITHRRRIRRGVDHTLVLARGASKASGIGIAKMLRARRRAEQIGLSATERAKNIRGAFYMPGSARKRGSGEAWKEIRALIVLDDVRTTGATLEEGCRVIRSGIREFRGENRPEIWAASVALAGDERKGGSETEVRGENSSKDGEIDREVEACGLT